MHFFYLFSDIPNDYDFQHCHLDDEDEHLSSTVSTVSDTSVTQFTSSDVKQEQHDYDYDAIEDEQAVLGKLLKIFILPK